MEPYTLDRSYKKVDIIDDFSSIIWTERYYGDSQVEMVVPSTLENNMKLPEGIFLGIPESNELMIIETANDEGNLKVSGISVLSWMNNRFIRTSNKHQDKYWNLEYLPGKGPRPGSLLWIILQNMCVEGSWYLSPVGTPNHIDIGIPSPEELAIPGLGLKSYDSSNGPIIDSIAIPYGPVYDVMREIATTYEIGMRITLEQVESNPLRFQSYKGLDRTSSQSANPSVRFSPQMDSFTDIKELRSIAALKTLAYAFAPGITDEVVLPPGTDAGTARLGSQNSMYTGFDLRALQVFADDITTENFSDLTALVGMLNERAYKGLAENPYVRMIDGEIVPTSQFKYGIDYNLGDIIEVQGNSGIIQKARVTEYIRSQDAAGEKAYPTVTPII
jgi:hypothetical protein